MAEFWGKKDGELIALKQFGWESTHLFLGGGIDDRFFLGVVVLNRSGSTCTVFFEGFMISSNLIKMLFQP